MYDVIVVGAGHNGLACAAYLAKAGRRVLVLESKPIVGGMCTTEETIAEAPGFKMNPCAVDLAMTSVPASIVDELNLQRFGLHFVEPDPWASFVNPDGASIAMWGDRSRTQHEIAAFSRRDAEKFESLCNTLNEAWWAAMPYFQDHPTRPTPRTVGQTLWRAAKGRRSLRGAAHVFMAPPEQIIEESFEREEVKALMANLAAWSMLPLQEDGSGGVLALMASYFRWAVNRPIGGSGEFTAALASAVTHHGGEVRVNAPVEEVLVSGQRATGVRLSDGTELHARHVIGAVDPATLINKLLDPAHVPTQTQEEMRAMGNIRWNITCLKVDMAIDRRPSLACGRDELMEGYLLLGPTLDYVRRAQAASINGELPDAMVMGPMFPSIVDRTQVPAGSDGETVYLYMPAVPLELSGGKDWDTAGNAYIDRVVHEFDSYLPGLEHSVIGRCIHSPKDLTKKATRGNVVHVDMSMSQMGPSRPTKSLSGYKTPVADLWHTGAGAHPFGALNGWSGRTTARLVDKHLRRDSKSRGPATPAARRLAAQMVPASEPTAETLAAHK